MWPFSVFRKETKSDYGILVSKMDIDGHLEEKILYLSKDNQIPPSSPHLEIKKPPGWRQEEKAYICSKP